MLVSSIQQSESVLHVYISVPLFLGYFPVTFRPLQNIESRSCATHWILIGCLLSYSSVFMAIPVSQCIASPAYPLVAVRLLSTSMTWLLFCEEVHCTPSFFFRFHIQAVLCYLSFCVWLISLSVKITRFIHVATNDIILSFYGWVIFHRMDIPHLLYPFLCWRTLRLLLCLVQCYK